MRISNKQTTHVRLVDRAQFIEREYRSATMFNCRLLRSFWGYASEWNGEHQTLGEWPAALLQCAIRPSLGPAQDPSRAKDELATIRPERATLAREGVDE
jgi:hypothetical protein